MSWQVRTTEPPTRTSRPFKRVYLCTFPLNAISKRNFTMRCAIQKPLTLLLKRFLARLTENNNYLPLFPGSDEIKNMDEARLKNIMLHSFPNVWAKHFYLQGWGFRVKTIRRIAIYSKEWKLWNTSTNKEHILKQSTRNIPTVIVTAGTTRTLKPPSCPTPRRSALASARRFVPAPDGILISILTC